MWLVENLESQGYHTRQQRVSGDPLNPHNKDDPYRFNILTWPGDDQNPRLLLSSHIDVVPPFYPYKRHHDANDTISGRGSVDDKGSVAAQIIATNNLLRSEKIEPGDVGFLFVVGEETGGDGMRAANALELNPKTILFGEPTEGKLAAGHKGNLGFTIHIKGKAAHSGYPWLGRSANEVLARVLVALMDLAPKLPSSDKYGVTTINLGHIEGGVAANVVAETASAQIAVRLAAGKPREVRETIREAIEDAARPFLRDGEQVEDFVSLEYRSEGYGPVDIDHDVTGFETITVNYGTDIPNLDPLEGQKRYLYGPGSILVAHSDHEALTVEQLEGAVEGYEKLILHALSD
ncbi:hypothetical protein MBLNU230_g5941t2 [Neophaeotheca triangularis]